MNFLRICYLVIAVTFLGGLYNALYGQKQTHNGFRYFPPARVGQAAALDEIEDLLLQKDWEAMLKRIEVYGVKYTDDTTSLIYLQNRKANALIALREYEKALHALENVTGYFHNNGLLHEAEYHTLRGISMHHLGRQAEARSSLVRAVSVREEQGSKKDHAYSLFVLGKIYRYGFLESSRAWELFVRSMNLLDEYNENEPLKGLLYYELGMTAFALGKVEESGQWARRAMVTFNTLTFTRDDSFYYPEIANTWKLLGIYYFNVDLDESMKATEEAISIIQKHEGSEAFDLGRYYNNLGIIYQFKGEITKAASYYHKGLKINQKYLYNQDRISNSYFNLGENLGIQGFMDSALFYYKKCLVEREKYYPKANGEIFTLYSHLAGLYFEYSMLDSALHYNLKALTEFVNNYDPESVFDNPDFIPDTYNQTYIFTLSNKSKIMYDMYFSNNEVGSHWLYGGLETFMLADSVLQVQKSQMIFDQTRVSYAQTFKGMYEEGIENSLKAFLVTGDDRFVASLITSMERNKANVLMDNIITSRMLDTTQVVSGVLEKDKLLKKTYAETELALIRATAENDKKLMNQLNDSLFIISRMQIQYRESYYSTLLKGNAIQTNTFDLQAMNIPDSLRILEYFWGDSALYIIDIDKQGTKVFRRQQVDSIRYLVNGFTRFVSDVHINSGIRIADEFQTFASGLFRILIPEYDPDDKRKLLIIPDGLLNQVPFEALITEKTPQTTTNYKSLKYLVKETNVSYSYSLEYYFDEWDNAGSGDRVIALAYSGTLESEALPGTYAEVNGIKEYYSGSFLIGMEATKSKFLKQASEFDIIHMGLHGFADSEEPLNNYLLFPPEEMNGDAEKLFAHDLYGLDLKAKLAVLSACDTGIGKMLKGEGVYSLAYAFSYAGVPEVVMSLWKIEDRATSSIIQRFYAHLSEGNSSGHALTLAKRDYLHNADNFTAHPSRWAGMIAVTKQAHTRPDPFNMRWIWVGIAIVLIASLFYSRYRLKNKKPELPSF